MKIAGPFLVNDAQCTELSFDMCADCTLWYNRKSPFSLFTNTTSALLMLCSVLLPRLYIYFLFWSISRTQFAWFDFRQWHFDWWFLCSVPGWCPAWCIDLFLSFLASLHRGFKFCVTISRHSGNCPEDECESYYNWNKRRALWLLLGLGHRRRKPLIKKKLWVVLRTCCTIWIKSGAIFSVERAHSLRLQRFWGAQCRVQLRSLIVCTFLNNTRMLPTSAICFPSLMSPTGESYRAPSSEFFVGHVRSCSAPSYYWWL